MHASSYTPPHPPRVARIRPWRAVLIGIGLGFLAPLLPAQTLAVPDEAEAHFVRRVWPLLKEKCLACHGDDEAKLKGDLDLRTREEMMVGGESGLPSVVPRKPDESPLLLATLREHGDWEAMPPKGARQAKRRTTACAAAPPTAATTTPMR